MAGREGGRNRPPRASSFRTVALLMLIPIAGILLFFLWGYAHRIALPAFASRGGAPPEKQARQQPVTASAIPTVTPAKRGEIVLILDDVGFDHQPLPAAMTIDPNVNFAVLPNGSRTREFAAELHAHGFELLCHLPMEPEGFPGVSPGSGAVLTSMSDAEIGRLTRENIETIRYARGVNNHMGSRATADRRVMTDVLSALPEGMYFIDSKTTGHSIAGSLAHSMRVKTASRNVFLDDVQNEGAIRKQLHELTRLAAAHGVAVGIGHMYPSTVNVLTAEAPRLRARGYRFVRASDAVQ